ncbi:MAG: nitrate reductase, partial [Desulfobacterales bacterium]|nr:nitrate reductase [Desulfobacterales bacterium]
MHDLYHFLTGPMVWIAFIVFIGGSLYRLIGMLMLVNKKEKWIYSYMSVEHGLRSILHWITPFATTNWKRHPAMTIMTFAFHICLIITPLFALAHLILLDESWGFRWGALPGGLADVMTLVVIAGCVFFLVRRLKLPEVRYLTSTSDYVLLAIVAA